MRHRSRPGSALERALSKPSPVDAMRTLPGFVDTCHFFGCEEPAPRGIRNVRMAAPPSQDEYVLDRVPLCTGHLANFMLHGQLRLKYHPAETGAKPVTRMGD